MEKFVLEANRKIIEKVIDSRIEEFKNNEIDKNQFINSMRILNELERKIAIEKNQIEYANFIKKIIDEQTLKIHKVNKSIDNKDFDYINKLTFHEKINILTTIISEFYDSINDPYEILSKEANEYLIIMINKEVNDILKNYGISLNEVGKMDISDFYRLIDDKNLGLDILYANDLLKGKIINLNL